MQRAYRHLSRFSRNSGDIDDVAFARNSPTIAAAVNGQEIRVWRENLAGDDWQIIWRDKIKGQISDIALNSSGDRLAIATFDTRDEYGDIVANNQLQVVNLKEKGAKPFVIPDRNDALGLILTEDNRLLVAREDGVVRAYPLEPKTLMDPTCQIARRNLSYEEWQSNKVALGEAVEEFSRLCRGGAVGARFVCNCCPARRCNP